ncbi:MAG: YihY/virulence factor BrkB family protein [Terracidiphilus sp.]|jgi:membrane protein
MSGHLAKIREALLRSLLHDVVNTSKAAAYSGMLMFFPGLLVITTVLAPVEEGPTLVGQTRGVLEQFVPSDTLDLVQSQILAHHLHSGRLIFSAACLSLFAALGVMLSFIEGFRRAYQLPPESWTFWGRRARALLLVFIVLVPLGLASLAIVFGHQFELWMIDNAGRELRHVVVLFWRMVRWSFSFFAIFAVLTALYHFATKRTESWRGVAPGAVAGTILWFPSTLVYGWYVTNFANYTRLYGSFAAGIATLVWLYITSFSVLLGAELNGILYLERQNNQSAQSAKDQTPAPQ